MLLYQQKRSSSLFLFFPVTPNKNNGMFTYHI